MILKCLLKLQLIRNYFFPMLLQVNFIWWEYIYIYVYVLLYKTMIKIKKKNVIVGKYYVADSRYRNTPGYLVPYKREQYHLSQYTGHWRWPIGKKELFNYYHSSLQNVIKCCFGIFKAKLHILKLMPPCSLHRQWQIVIVACALHDFIKIEMQSDRFYFILFQDEGFIVENNYDENNDDNGLCKPLELGAKQERQELTCKTKWNCRCTLCTPWCIGRAICINFNE